MPILHDFMATHARDQDYITEINTCDDSNCKLCRKFGDCLRMPNTKNGLLRDVILFSMNLPVADPSRVGNFVLPEMIRGFVSEMKILFEMLKKELPKREKIHTLRRRRRMIKLQIVEPILRMVVICSKVNMFVALLNAANTSFLGVSLVSTLSRVTS